MRVGLLNLEPKYKNLALEKLRIYHQSKGDSVEDYFALVPYDRVYASSIFDYTPKFILPEGAICGGSGFDLVTNLPDEVEAIEPHLNFGFTTRGCIRKCPFCIVPQKEGHIRAVGDLLSLWDGKSKDIRILDNNILALSDHFAMMCEQALKYKLRLDFNQGLDHRLLTPEIVDLLVSIRHTEYRFAFDHPSYFNSVEKAIDLLWAKGIKRSTWYVLVGFDTTFQEDLDRLNYLKGRNQNAFVQRYNKNKLGRKYTQLARWANQHHIFQGMRWEQFNEL